MIAGVISNQETFTKVNNLLDSKRDGVDRNFYTNIDDLELLDGILY